MAGTIGLGLLLVVALAMTALFLRYGSLWIQAYSPGGYKPGKPDRHELSPGGNKYHRAHKIMIAQAGLDITQRRQYFRLGGLVLGRWQRGGCGPLPSSLPIEPVLVSISASAPLIWRDETFLMP